MPTTYDIRFTPEAAAHIPPTARNAYSVKLDKPMPVGSRWETEAVPMQVIAVSGRVILIGLAEEGP